LSSKFGPGATEKLVDFNSTLEVVQRKALSTSTGQWKWCNGEPCRLQLDTGPGAKETFVDFNSTLDLVQRKALSTGSGVGEVGTVSPGVKR